MGLEQWYWYYTAFFGSLGPDRDNAPEPTCGTLMWYSTTCSHSLYTHSQPATNALRARRRKKWWKTEKQVKTAQLLANRDCA